MKRAVHKEGCGFEGEGGDTGGGVACVFEIEVAGVDIEVVVFLGGLVGGVGAGRGGAGLLGALLVDLVVDLDIEVVVVIGHFKYDYMGYSSHARILFY